ncbi:hypothetical protein [Streptomyces sp. NPDC002088]|uniref:hypothetical protein n=1 Tax=Streptomyces sp. NPDC002088 TaxID=3154665 RepID=UPI0033210089
MNGLLETAGGLLARRRLITTWLPVLLFVSALTVVGVAAVGTARAEAWWADLPGQARAVAGVVFLTTTVLAAEILAGFRPAVVRLYEGYWSPLPGGKALMRSGRERIAAAADPERPWTSPTPDRLMPTRLGNILAAAEQQADRYGMDAVTAWPRLYTALPEPFTILFGQAAASLELMISVSALGGLFALVACPVAAVILPWYWAPLLLWAGGLLAWAGYRGALGAAARYGELVRTAFDVHRWLLLDAMGLSRPESWAAELRQWEQIHQLWQRGRPDSGSAHLLGYPAPTDTDPASPATPPRTGPPLPVSGTPEAEPPPPTPDEEPHPPTLDEEPQPLAHGAPSPGRRPLLIALCLGVLAILGAALPDAFRDEGVTASRDLPDFHVLTAADLSGPAPGLVGRYTLRPIGEHAQVSPYDLGPVLPEPGLTGRVVTTLTVQRPVFMLDRGDILLVLPLSQKGPAARVTVLEFSAAKDKVTVAVTEAELSRLLSTKNPVFQLAR